MGTCFLQTNKEMGEAGLAARSASEIERISILARGNADARLARAIIEQHRFLHLFCDASGVVSLLVCSTAVFQSSL